MPSASFSYIGKHLIFVTGAPSLKVLASHLCSQIGFIFKLFARKLLYFTTWLRLTPHRSQGYTTFCTSHAVWQPVAKYWTFPTKVTKLTAISGSDTTGRWGRVTLMKMEGCIQPCVCRTRGTIRSLWHGNKSCWFRNVLGRAVADKGNYARQLHIHKTDKRRRIVSTVSKCMHTIDWCTHTD